MKHTAFALGVDLFRITARLVGHFPSLELRLITLSCSQLHSKTLTTETLPEAKGQDLVLTDINRNKQNILIIHKVTVLSRLRHICRAILKCIIHQMSFSHSHQSDKTLNSLLPTTFLLSCYYYFYFKWNHSLQSEIKEVLVHHTLGQLNQLSHIVQRATLPPHDFMLASVENTIH